MSISSKPTKYHSFLLRLWLDADAQTWRYSLEDPHTGARRGLANMEALIDFLKEVMEQAKYNDSATSTSA